MNTVLILLVVCCVVFNADGQRTSFKIARGTPKTIVKATPKSIIKPRAIGPTDANSGQYKAGNEGRYIRSGNEGQYVANNDDRYDHSDVKGGQYKEKEYFGRAKLQKTAAYRFAKTAFKQPIVATTTFTPTEPPSPPQKILTAQPRIITTQPKLSPTQPPFRILQTTKQVTPQNGQEWLIIRNKNEVHQDGYHSLYETGNGILAEEAGRIQKLDRNEEGLRSSGYYQYVGDDGKLYQVRYTADNNGFHAEGDHLPKPHPLFVKLSQK